jgi:hypothetical protein
MRGNLTLAKPLSYKTLGAKGRGHENVNWVVKWKKPSKPLDIIKGNKRPTTLDLSIIGLRIIIALRIITHPQKNFKKIIGGKIIAIIF